MKDWSESEFRQRVRARIEQLGAQEAALLRDAGLPADAIRKKRKQGARIDTIIGIARALRWTLGQALGLQDPTRFFDRELEIDPAKLTRALRIAETSLGDNPAGDRLDVIAARASLIYSVLAEREAAGRPLDDFEAHAVIESLLRRFFTK